MRNCCILKGRCSVKWTTWKTTWQVVYLGPITALIDSKEIFSLIGEFICNLSIRARLYTWKFSWRAWPSQWHVDVSRTVPTCLLFHFSFSTATFVHSRREAATATSYESVHPLGQCRSHALSLSLSPTKICLLYFSSLFAFLPPMLARDIIHHTNACPSTRVLTRTSELTLIRCVHHFFVLSFSNEWIILKCSRIEDIRRCTWFQLHLWRYLEPARTTQYLP